MKIRIGFVSNSSSQAFVVRGIKTKLGILKQLLEVPDDCADPEWEIYKKIEKPLEAHSAEFFFTTDCSYKYNPNREMIVGAPLGNLEDGVVTKIAEPDDEEIRRLLEEVGLEPVNIGTYIQYISNDNF